VVVYIDGGIPSQHSVPSLHMHADPMPWICVFFFRFVSLTTTRALPPCMTAKELFQEKGR